MIHIKRAYDEPEPGDGVRILVDRLWPRGIRKDELHLDGWNKEVAPSNELRSWFGHEPGRWEDFNRRYFNELDKNPAAWQPILKMARSGNVTLLHAARDREHNNAVALATYLAARLAK